MNLDILAGKMSFDGKKVSPDNRKGILRLSIDVVQDAILLQWLDRSVEPPKLETEWSTPVSVEEVPSAKSGKVYVITKEGRDKQFVWIQQQAAGSALGDAAGFSSEKVDSVEALMNQIQIFAQMPTAREAMEMHAQMFGNDALVESDQMLVDLGHHAHEDEDEDEDLEELMEQLMDQEGADEDQIASMLLGNAQIMTACLIGYLEGLCMLLAANPSLANLANSANSANSSLTNAHQTPVSAVLTSEAALSLLSPETRLLDLCPEGESDLREVLKSPQFSEAMRALTEGIYSDQIAGLFASLGLEMNPAGEDPFEALCKALEKKFNRHPR